MAQKLGSSKKRGSTSRSTPPRTRRRRSSRSPPADGPGDLLRARGRPRPRTGARRDRVGALVNRPLTSLIWLAELGDQRRRRTSKGKTVADRRHPLPGSLPEDDPEPGATCRLRPVKQVNVGFGLLPALIGGSAQAMLGGYSQRRGRRPAAARQSAGRSPRSTSSASRPTTSSSSSPTTRRWKKTRKSIRLFIAALERGTEAAVANPKAATEAILAANSGLEPKLTEAEVEATLPLLAARTRGQPYGYMDPEEWEAFVGWMRDKELIAVAAEPPELLINAYLARRNPRIVAARLRRSAG